jgi:thiamine pyrophosphate-dependent acetolactate synthase large subunit-like protein
MNQERDIYADAYGGQLGGRHGELWHFTDVDFVAMARTLGCDGIRVDHPGQFAQACEQAFAATVPTVIDVRTDIEAMAPLGWAGRDQSYVRCSL